jgi:hypothetical protein
MGYEASAEEIFLAALPWREWPRSGAARPLADAERGTGHGGECNLPSAFQQEIVAAAIRFQPLQPKCDARLAADRAANRRESNRIGASIAMM